MQTADQLYWLEQTLADVPSDNQWLTSAERRQLDRLRVPKRRREWRLGRWTAKYAVVSYMHWPPRRVAEIEIRARGTGAPEVIAPGTLDVPAISISHSSDTAMCVLARPGTAVGCDLEAAEPRSREFIQTYFTPSERTQIEGLSKAETAILATVIWSAKESFLKATQEGLRRDTQEVEVILGPTSIAVRLQIEKTKCLGWLPFRVESHFVSAKGCWRLKGEMVETVVYF